MRSPTHLVWSPVVVPEPLDLSAGRPEKLGEVFGLYRVWFLPIVDVSVEGREA